MGYKFEVNFGLKQYAWLIFSNFLILLFFSILGFQLGMAFGSTEPLGFCVMIGLFIAFIHTIKYFIENISIIPIDK